MRNFSTVYTLYRSSKCRILLKGNANKGWTKCNIYIKKRFLSSLPKVAISSNCAGENSSHKLVIPKKFNFAADVLDNWARKERDGIRSASVPALWCVSNNGEEYKINFQQLEYQSKRVASILETRCGVKRGDNVIVILPKIPEFWLVVTAAFRIGFVVCPATTMLTVKDLAYRFSALKPSCVIAHESVADAVDKAEQTSISLKEKVIISSSPNRAGWLDFHRLQPETDDHKCVDSDSDDTVMIYFTSGTTGFPKMVEHAHGIYALGMGHMAKYWLNVEKENVVWNMSDTGWALTAYNSIFGPWSHGAGVFVHQMPQFSPKTTLEVLSKYPINILSAAPLVYRALVQENLSAYKFKKLKHCISGGETMNVEVIKKWEAATGLKIYEGYGQTENTGCVVMQKSFEFRIGSMGKPMPGINVKIVDQNEIPLEAGLTGEIVVERKNSFGLFKGYKNDPAETKKVLTEKYFHTGDLGYYDEDGYFWFVGRNDDLINSAGYRIGPTEVENALMEHSAVIEVAAISSPDPERGEVVKAFIILNNTREPSNKLVKELQDHCKVVTSPYKYPRKIEFVKEFPKTVSGKIKRYELKKREWKNV